MSDLDDLVAALELGDPDETIPLERVRAMAESALSAGWRPTTPEQAAEARERMTADQILNTIKAIRSAHPWMFPVPEGPDDGR